MIVGGSIAGMASAAALHRAGHEVTVYERLSYLGDQGAGLGVNTSLIEQVTGRSAVDITALPVVGVHSMIQVPGANLVVIDNPELAATTVARYHAGLRAARSTAGSISTPRTRSAERAS